MRTPVSSTFPLLAAITLTAALPGIVPARADDAKPGAPGATPTPEYTGPKRAGGGPTNPEIHFPLPPPKPLTPQEEMKTFKLPPGFHAELVASEPTIQAPIAVSWDDQGRMYVVEMRSYMHDVDGTGEDQPTCRISRLESTKGNGVYDKATVFVDNLVLPRTVMALGDGAVVNVPPNLIWYHDKSGTGVSDGQEIISTHYATPTGQPEHMANSATWMMDNWISSANYGFDFRLQNGSFLTRPTVTFGQWGNTQDDWGRQFTNSNSDLLRAHLVPPSYYLRNPHLVNQSGLSVQVMKDQTTWPAVPTPGVNRGYMEDTMKDGKLVKGGSLRMDGTLESVTATCGPAVYRGDLFPPEYRGNVFIPEPAGNLVKRVTLSEKDGVITAANAYEGKEFMTSTDERFRPVNAYTGPDGALYIVDIARGIIQHKAFVTYYLAKNIEERKLSEPVNLGRIYRIVPDNTHAKIVQLPKETTRLPAMLTHPNGWVRDTAQRVLVERGEPLVVPDIKSLAATGATPQTRVQALWTLEGMNALNPDVIAIAIHDKNEKVRAAGVRLADPVASLQELVKLVKDPSAEVRMHLAFKLSGRDEPAATQALLTLLEGNGPIFGEAAASGLSGHEVEYLDTLLKLPTTEDAKLEKSNVFAILAGCVMKERNAEHVSHLLDLIAAQSSTSRQVAMLNGMAGKAPSKKSKYIPRPLKLTSAPAGLATLQTSRNSKIKEVLSRVDPQIVWSGKPGWVEPIVPPLTTAQKALYEQGKTVYSTICVACHQPTGNGMAGLAPPLVDSEWVQGQPDKIIRIVTQGLSGPVEVKGNKWELDMPGLPIFTDEQIAGILTYIRREWENTGSAVDPAFVTSVRAAIKDHTKPWTATELQKPVEGVTVSAKK
jgi:mono/diheme cytochrome c family protein/glucose/arabinose dehydrogenase/HEAT repeat protein